jgi:ferredoxin-NADP reductase
LVKHKLKIVDIREEAEQTKTYLLEKPADFNWEEGSHTHIALNGYDDNEIPDKSLVRHMSIMTLDTENRIGFTTRIPESGSEYKRRLAKLNVGDELIVFKLGSRMRLRRENREIVLLSMGVGIATMRPLIVSYLNNQSDIPHLTNINVDSNTIFQTELDLLKNSFYTNYWTKSRVQFYQTLTEVMKNDNSIYYIVGSDTFLRTIIKKLKANNVSVEDIMIDKKDGILQLYYDF